MSARDYRDGAIESLADSERVLTERLADATVQCDTYRLIAVAAMTRLNELRTELDGVTERYHRSLDDARQLRAKLIRQDDQRAAA